MKIRRLLAVICSVPLLAGCGLVFGPTKTSAARAIPAFEALFPTIEQFQIEKFFVLQDPPCEFITDVRGDFSADLSGLASQQCSHVFGPTTEVPVDAQAAADLASVNAAIDRTGVPVRLWNASLAPDGTLLAPNVFSADGCINFYYDAHGWSVLPPDDGPPGSVTLTTAINKNWYQTDGCPPFP